jgi:hypothetical protein
MKNQRKHQLAATLTLIGFASLTLSASAADPDDAKTIPGNACQPLGADQAAGLEAWPQFLRNTSGTGRYVTCPLVTDNFFNYDGLTGAYGFFSALSVWVYNGDAPVTCTAFVSDAVGGTLDSATMTVSGSGNKVLSTSALDLSATGGPAYSVLCYLPNNSAIYKISYVEDGE